uniref:Uncharacterized protein n=1 Tax=Oryza rufipogon TaxID=4529 RepID=A0A0E0NWL1_ORYRU
MQTCPRVPHPDPGYIYRTMLERLVNLVVKPFNLPVKKKKRGRLETKEDSATYPWFQSGARGREHVPNDACHAQCSDFYGLS